MLRRLVRLVGVVVLLLCAQARAEDAIVVKMLGSGLHAYFAHDPARAMTYLTSAIDGGTRDPRAYYFRGLCYLQMGAEEQAKGDFLLGAQLEGSNTNTFFNVPRSLERVQGGERMVLEQYRAEARMTAIQLEEARNRERYDKKRQEQGRALTQQVAPAIPVAPQGSDPTAAFQSGPVKEPVAPAAEAPAAEAPAAAPALVAEPSAPAAAKKPAAKAKPAEATDMPAAPADKPAAPAAPADDPFAVPAKPADKSAAVKPAAVKPAEKKTPPAAEKPAAKAKPTETTDMPAAAADDPFAAPAKPAAKAPEKKPPADDPFAVPAADAKPAGKPAAKKPAADNPPADTMDAPAAEKPADDAKPADTMEMSSDQAPAADSKPAADEPAAPAAKPAAKTSAKPGAKLPNLPAKKADASDPFGGPAPSAPAAKVTDPFKTDKKE